MNNQIKFSYGVVPAVARKLGISTQLAQYRIKKQNPEAIKIAVELELQKRKEQSEAKAQLQKLAS